MTARQLHRVQALWDNGAATLLEALTLQIEALEWQKDALCREMDPELFFDIPEVPGSLNAARRACSLCPVRDECLEWALDSFDDDEDHYGIFGGVGPKIRREMRSAPRQEVAA